MFKASHRPDAVRVCFFVASVGILSLVCDGWSGKPSPTLHQLILLPLSVAFLFSLICFLRRRDTFGTVHGEFIPFWPLLSVLAVSEALAVLMMLVESRHFRTLGYRLTWQPSLLALCIVTASWVWYFKQSSGTSALLAVGATYGAGMLLAIRDFPLNYLRSDMLPVISWADLRLLQGLNPYGTMYVGGRVYDFPYLPGMLVMYLPAVFLHIDLRWAALLYTLGTAALIVYAARERSKQFAALCVGVFLLCPFLQYRHDLYLQPHWFLLALAIFLFQRKHPVWSAFAWGLSCGVYQLSWVIVPFAVLQAFRTGALREAAKFVLATAAGFLCIAGPFLPLAAKQVARNSVGQWSHMGHALAEPINLSYWLTFFVHPDQLRWLQAVVC